MIELISLIFKLLDIYSFLLLIRVMLSWFPIDPYNSVVQFLYNITEPVLRPLRTVVSFGGMGIDFSPVIAVFIIQIIKKILISLIV